EYPAPAAEHPEPIPETMHRDLRAGHLQAASESQYVSMRARIAVSGSAPVAARRFVSRFATLVVPGIAQVMAGCDSTYLSRNSAHVPAPNSPAHGGSGRSPSLRNRLPSRRPPNGMLTSTATPLS